MSGGIERRTVLKGMGASLLLGGLSGCGLSRDIFPVLAQPPVLDSGNTGQLTADIVARYGNYDLAGRPVSLRGYDGLPVGKTLRIKAGDRLNVTLSNEMPFELPQAGCGNLPHSFNVTNLHLHGAHVSPNEPQDFVLLELVPHETVTKGGDPKAIWQYAYKYQIPPEHPCGTYFYHSHYHGSVAMQVSSGMAGALIITGDLDKIPDIARAREQVMIFHSPRVDADGRCEDPALLEESGRTFINGQLTPRVVMGPGEVQRWRMVNATHMTMLDLRCEAAAMVLLCRDGNALPEARLTDWPLRLVPGNRADLLVQAPREPGLYFVHDGVLLLAVIDVQDQPAPQTRLYLGPLPSVPALAPIDGKDVTYGRRLVFGMSGAPPQVVYTVNNRPFSCKLDDAWPIPLKAIEEWEVVNQTNDIHPFHIHTNPFQMVEGGNAPPGTWLDTVEIPPAQRIRFRTRFSDYAGYMVFHCHTLMHEDMGMMQLLKITT